MFAEIVLLIFLQLISGLFAMAEIAVVSSRKSRLQQMAEAGNKGAARALRLADNPSSFLSTVQIGITLISILLGAIGAQGLAAPLGAALPTWLPLGNYAQPVAFSLVIIAITGLSLFISELVPKRIAMHWPESLASALAAPLEIVARTFSPVVWILGRTTDGLIRAFGLTPSVKPGVTEEEIQMIIDQGTEAGVIEESEQDMVEGVFSLSDSRVYSLMTPRTEIIWIDINGTVDDIRDSISRSEYSRFPVCDGSLDTVLGIVKARDLLAPPALSSPDFRLREKLRTAFFIPESMLASRALEFFKEKSAELVFVVDEFGALQGLLTLNDIIEEIVGDIQIEPQATQRPDGSWLLDGMLPTDEFKKLFGVTRMPHEDEYESLSGFVMISLGRIPITADRFNWEGLLFEVVDMDGQRVDKVLVTRLPATVAQAD